MDKQLVARELVATVKELTAVLDPYATRQEAVDKLQKLARYIDDNIDILEGKSYDDPTYFRRVNAEIAKLVKDVEKFEAQVKKRVSRIGDISWG